MDEYHYVFQSQVFSQGKMSIPVNAELPDFLLDEMMLKYGDKLFSKYPPFYTFLLSIANFFNSPFIVNPLLSVLSLILVFKILTLYFNPKTATWTTLIVSTNLYFVGYTASYFAQSTSLFLTLLTFWALLLYKKTPRIPYLWIMGAGLFCLVPTRPLDALIQAIFLGLLVLFQENSIKEKAKLLAVVAVGILLGTLFMMSYNYLQSGYFKIVSYKIWNSEFKIIGAKNSILDNALYIIQSYFDHFQFFLIPLFKNHFITVINFGVILLTLTSFWNKRIKLHLWGLALFLLYILLYNFHEGLGFPLYGSRYWYPAWAGLVLMIASGLELVFKWRKVTILLGIFIVFQTYHTTLGIKDYAARTTFALEVKSYLDSKCSENSIIPIEENVTDLDHSVPFIFYTQFVRNAFFNGPHLYARKLSDAVTLHQFYPEYAICTPVSP
jgi:hypothetical protein